MQNQKVSSKEQKQKKEKKKERHARYPLTVFLISFKEITSLRKKEVARLNNLKKLKNKNWEERIFQY